MGLIKTSKLSDSHPARLYNSIWHEISVMGNLMAIGNRIIVPKAARKDILETLHSVHTGQIRMKKRAQELYFWPGMTNEIVQHVAMCDPCQVFAPSKAKNMDNLETKAKNPMQALSADLFEAAGKQ